MTSRTLWVVTPVYHDVESCLILRTAILKELERIPFPRPERTQFVVIDDSGNQDQEIEQLDALPDVTTIAAPFNLGHQRALVFGLRSLAPGIDAADWVVTLDSDGEDRPEDIARLLEPLAASPAKENRLILAWRTSRQEAFWFKAMYVIFKFMFRFLTGTVIRTGNFAAARGQVVKQVLYHPAFDWSYASALLSLNLPATFVPCGRGARYAGRSKMGFSQLITHGLRMLMPFIDRIATRALIMFGALFAGGLAALTVVGVAALFTSWTIPQWAELLLLTIVAVSLSAFGNFIILFVVFAQSRAFSLRGLNRED